MKICSKCNKNKELDLFYKKGKRLHSWCKKCFNTMCIERWKTRKVEAIKYLGDCCKDCGKRYHPNVFDFHHLRDKDAQWTKLRLRSWDKITKELDKCVLLCSNCHRVRHII